MRNFTSHKAEKNKYELLRFCSKLNYNVRGAASKLFKYFISKYSPEEILSYSNSDIGFGNLYEILNFSFYGFTTPNY